MKALVRGLQVALACGAMLVAFGCSSRSREESSGATAPEREALPNPSGGTGAGAGTRGSTPATVSHQRVIVALGDSISAGYGVEPGKSYPDFLQQELEQAGYAYRVVNAGISGDTSSGGLARLDSVLAHEPEIVIVELGGNDGLRGVPLTATRDNLEQIITRLKKEEVQVVLVGMTLPRNYGARYIAQFEQIFEDLAKRHRLPLVGFGRGAGESMLRLLQPDGLHPTVEGNRKLAGIVMGRLEPLLEKQKPL
jgi:acyl-CoA thioesterase I